MKTLIVCAAVIRREGKVLLAQRKNSGAQGLLWEFPGGKLISGESPEECLVREIKEELDMDIIVEEVFQIVSHFYQADTQILLLAYLCKHLKGEGKALDCHDFHWVDIGNLKEYELAAADIPILNKLVGA
ncbi:MAG TPA: (deoxy)nucleoside triphosphate pyrophosphohydrolase [Candidatus Deferrimicrobium sp.]|nr:(deoxy)nucleoside triphosphate pyrophosphohydrolase [Candidatus Deferrimicrobium sp.]